MSPLASLAHAPPKRPPHGPVVPDLDQLKCKCNLDPKLAQAKHGANAGRAYATCVKSAHRCDFWLWMDGKPSNAASNGGDAAPRGPARKKTRT